MPEALRVSRPVVDANLPNDVKVIMAMFGGFGPSLDPVRLLFTFPPDVVTDKRYGDRVTHQELMSLVSEYRHVINGEDPQGNAERVEQLDATLISETSRGEVAQATQNLVELVRSYPGFPVWRARLRQMRIGMPSIDWRGNVDDPRKIAMASGALYALSSVVLDGDVPDL